MRIHASPDPDVQQDSPADAAALSAAMDAGIAGTPLPEPTQTPEPAPAAAPAPDAAKPAEVDPFAEPEAPKVEPIPGTEEAKNATDVADPAAKEGGEPAAKTPEQQADEARRAENDKEADRLQLKKEARDRFHALNDTIAQQAPLIEALTKAGIKDAAQLPQVIEHAQAGRDMVALVMETGASPQQYTMALDYLAAAKAAATGNVQAAEQCWNWMLEELQGLAPLLGKEVPGLVDPLAAHADLQQDVDAERITRERALELAKSRNTDALRTANAEAARTATQQQTQQQEAYRAAIEKGRADLTALGPQLAANDPGGAAAYRAKEPALIALVKDVTAKLPPDQWRQAIALGYLKIPEPAPHVQPGSPMRSGGTLPSLAPEFTDPHKALDFELDRVSRGE